MNVLVTGAKGFIGKNLVLALKRRSDLSVWQYDIDSAPEMLDQAMTQAEVVFHLAGINRPQREEEFEQGNVDFLVQVLDALERMGRRPLIVLSSSTQAALDNPYGRSKRRAEENLFAYSQRTGMPTRIFRLPGVFGKWCRPNYNSVVATLCHNSAQGLPLTISDPLREIELVYVDDVVSALLHLLEMAASAGGASFALVEPTFRVTLGRLVAIVQEFAASRQTLRLPDLQDPLVRRLYATYQSYLPPEDFAYDLQQRRDEGEAVGQLFVSRTRPGCTRGNHYHDTKVEKFVVVEGDAVIRFRHMATDEVVSYPVSGKKFRVVDIPPGWTHHIENVGTTELVVLFWASEVFDAERPDTYAAEVSRE